MFPIVPMHSNFPSHSKNCCSMAHFFEIRHLSLWHTKKKWCTNLVTLIMKSHLFGVQTCFRWLTLVRSGFYVVLYQLFFLVHFSHWSSSVMDHLRPCIFLISSCALHISFTIQTLFWGERTVNIYYVFGEQKC